MTSIENVIALLCIAVVFGLAGWGAGTLLSDYRHFNTLKTQCEKVGYFQDKQTRIHCQVEKPHDTKSEK